MVDDWHDGVYSMLVHARRFAPALITRHPAKAITIIIYKLAAKLSYSRDLRHSDKLDHLTAQFELMTEQLKKKEERIGELERKVVSLEAQADSVEQYTSRPNLRFQGMKEIDLGEDTDAKIIHLVNEKMHMDPPLKNEDVE